MSCQSKSSSKSAYATQEGAVLIPIDGHGVQKLVQSAEASSVVVTNFWATWCGPCKEEFPDFLSVSRAYAERGVKFHFISMDFPEETPAAIDFLKTQGAPLPSYIRKGKDHDFIMSIRPMWSGAIPATGIYGPNGELRYFWEGKVDKATLTRALDSLVRESEVDLR